jgi:hypothetical protein
MEDQRGYDVYDKNRLLTGLEVANVRKIYMATGRQHRPVHGDEWRSAGRSLVAIWKRVSSHNGCFIQP